MIDPETYTGLPDGMPPDLVRTYILRLLESFQADAAPENLNAFMQALNQLAERQWHTYQRLDDRLRKEVEEVLLRVLTASMSLEQAEQAASIVARLGLPETLAHLARVAKGASEAVREELEASAQELSETVGDPYSGL